MKPGRLLRAAFVLAVLPVLCACAQVRLNVAHLQHAPWSVGGPHSLVTKFMRFDYRIAAAGVSGRARLLTSRLPSWAKRIDSMAVTAYLCDAKGTVLAHDTLTFRPRPVRADEGIGFDFLLRPGKEGGRPLFVAFGYRLTLTRGGGAAGAPFFASEDAIAH